MSHHESMFNSFSFVVGLMGDGGEDLQGVRCFVKRRIISFFLYLTFPFPSSASYSSLETLAFFGINAK